MDFSYRKMIIKGLKSFIFTLIALILAGLQVKYPNAWGFAIGTSTVGALLTMLFNFLKNRWDVNLP